MWFVEHLKSRKKLSRSYFMQDGATPHTAISTRQMIQDIFGDRVVGKPADFWLWPTLKRMIFNSRNQPYTSIGSLKKAITFAFNKLRQGNLEYLTPAVVKRLRLFQTNNIKASDNEFF